MPTGQSKLEQHHHTKGRNTQSRMLNAKSVGRKDISIVAACPRKGKRVWEVEGHGKSKPAKVHELMTQAAV